MKHICYGNYQGSFGHWADVHNAFGDPCPAARPRYVFAVYDHEDYEGRALVLTSNNGRTFRVVEGYHCSCFGLEDQWEDTSYGVRAIRKMLKADYGMFNTHRADIERWLKHIRPKPKKAPKVEETV